MNYSLPLGLFALPLLISACSTQPHTPPSRQNEQLELSLGSGTYTCEHGQRIRVERELRDHINHRIRIAWNGSNYRLERDRSYSGLPRFQDASSGLVWIDMPLKSLLLDGRTNKPLANECRIA